MADSKKDDRTPAQVVADRQREEAIKASEGAAADSKSKK